MTELNPKKLEVLTEKVMNDAAGALAVLMAYLGDQAGVYAPWIRQVHFHLRTWQSARG